MSSAILSARFRILTPMFIGDAAQRPRLRAPAIKGVMRMWYRAVDPKCWNDDPKDRGNESSFFGGQGKKEGQSPWFLTVEKGAFGSEYSLRRGGLGLNYLGYPFHLRGGERRAIAPGKTFTLRCLVPRRADDAALRRALTASLWCLGNFGALGTRSRRGFGAVALEAWEAEQGDWPELDALSLLSDVPEKVGAAGVAGVIRSAVETFHDWFGTFDDLDPSCRPHPHLGPGFRFKCTGSPHEPERWEGVLDEMGSAMQVFRSKQKKGDARLAASALRGQRIDRAPDRATFGLPLSFRFRNERGQVNFVPVDPQRKELLERQGSLLFLRPILVGGRLYPLYLRMDGAVPGIAPPAGTQKHRRALGKPARNAMDEFFDGLSGEAHHG